MGTSQIKAAPSGCVLELAGCQGVEPSVHLWRLLPGINKSEWLFHQHNLVYPKLSFSEREATCCPLCFFMCMKCVQMTLLSGEGFCVVVLHSSHPYLACRMSVWTERAAVHSSLVQVSECIGTEMDHSFLPPSLLSCLPLSLLPVLLIDLRFFVLSHVLSLLFLLSFFHSFILRQNLTKLLRLSLNLWFPPSLPDYWNYRRTWPSPG